MNWKGKKVWKRKKIEGKKQRKMKRKPDKRKKNIESGRGEGRNGDERQTLSLLIKRQSVKKLKSK